MPILKKWELIKKIIETKTKLDFLRENHKGFISDLHIKYQYNYLKQLKWTLKKI